MLRLLPCRPVKFLNYLFLLLALPGCQAFQAYRPVPVLVLDADTKMPIKGSEVRITYPTLHHSNAPWTSSGLTGPDGIVHLRAASVEDAIVMAEVTAHGYMFEQKELPNKTLQSLNRVHLFEAVDKRPVAFVVELYTEPRPMVDLIVPAGYRGLVKADIQIVEDIALPANQRSFSYPVPPSGLVQIKGSPLFRHVFPQSIGVKFADGYPLTQNAKESDLGFWWLKSEGHIQFFLVGSKRDFDEFCLSEKEYGRGGRSYSDGAKEESRGRRNRRGNQQSQP